MHENQLFVGPIVHNLEPTKLTIIPEGLLVVRDSKIVAVEDGISGMKKYVQEGAQIRKLRKGQFLCPGLVDLHIHACQYPNVGLGYDKSLLDWLHTYTFPLEMKYKDTQFAVQVYRYVVGSTLKCGTTTACYYGTIHTESCLKLAEIISNFGQRAIVGKVNMDQNSVPEYVETTQQSLRETEKFIDGIKKFNNPLVEAAVTPRFAIACSSTLMKELGKLAQQHDLYIQTHICENEKEVAFTREIFPDSSNYASIYHETGLLTEKTILGHGIFLSDEEKKLLHSMNSSVAHCPNSNFLLRSGSCNVRSLQKFGIKIGLGTDISGGSSMSLLDAMRNALINSINLFFNDPSLVPLSYAEVFYMATLGGARALRKENEIGNFTVGKRFDALLVDMNEETASIAGVLPSHSLEDLVQKFIYCGDDRNIREVYVNGKLVVQK